MIAKLYKKAALLGAAGLFAAGLAAPVQAATLDFVGFANGNEQGVGNGTAITSTFFGGETIRFSATGNTANAVAYFDSGNAGLGVCSDPVSVNAGPSFIGQGANNKCNPGSDDNVTVGESVTLTFDSARTLSGLLFNAEGHHALVSDTLTLAFGINGGPLLSYTFANLMTQSFSNVISATFAFDDANSRTTAEQFYLASANISAVPVPAAGLLLMTGLGGLAAMRRRKRAA